MSSIIAEMITLETETCCSCGVVFGMPQRLKRERMDYGGSFFCPNGHSQYYDKSEVQKLKEQLEAKERDLRAAKCETISERHFREAVEKKLKRVRNGVCPCCRRSFPNLARHMASKHPEMKKNE